MSKTKGKRRSPPRRAPSPLEIYLAETRDIGLSLALVVPLLLAYEILMLLLQAPLRNGAEMVVMQSLSHLPPETLSIVRRSAVGLLIVASVLWVRTHPPAVARARWVLLESLALALVLGPLVGFLVGRIGLSVAAPVSAESYGPWMPFLLSVGAGLWEEIVFRLFLLGGLAFVLARTTSLGAPGALSIAIVTSALAFAFYHHVGDFGEPFEASRFAFRAIAGTILGVLFVFRGLAVVVYMHVFYDLLCDVQALAA